MTSKIYKLVFEGNTGPTVIGPNYKMPLETVGMDALEKVASLEAENQVLREKVNKLEDEVQNLLDLKRELFTLKEMLLKEVDDE